MKQQDRDALKDWEAFKESIRNATPVDPTLSPADIEKHRKELEKNVIAWILFFFPKYARYPFAPFQIKAILRIIAHGEWYEVLSWARELAKSTIVMFIVMYLTLTGKKKNVLLVSSSKDNAVRLLAPYRANLEANQRIIAYYGQQANLGNWTEDEFITKGGAAFRALGKGQSPRGSRNEEIRPDVLLVDDYDTDESVRNPDMVAKEWEWYEHALYPTRSTSEDTLILWAGNIIADDCCVVRAGRMADHHDVINIRMVDIRRPDPKNDYRDGKSVWPEKNSEERIDRILAQISTRAAMGEYFNYPAKEGEVFTEMKFGKVPPLKKFPFLVAYGDPAPGENKKTRSSTKTVWLGGMIGDRLYVIRGFLDRGLNSEYIDWFAVLKKYVGGQTNVYLVQENNSLQDPFFRQVFKPLVAKKRREENIDLNIIPDEERKTDKATRIEANLEPMNREGRLILNEAEKDDPHMKRLVDQFMLFTLQLKFPADGPDCIEGLKRWCERKQQQRQPLVIMSPSVRRSLNRNRI